MTFTSIQHSVSQVPLPAHAVNVVAIAASTGGLKALTQILGALRTDLPAAIVVVVHLYPHHPSVLAQLLSRKTALTVTQAREGNRLCDGCVYVAPPDRHLIVETGGLLTLSSAAKVHYTRPAADPLFISVAAIYGKRAIGIVLTGGDGDGSAGIEAIKEAGGITIAQNEATSQVFSMPRSAIATGDVDYVCPLAEIGPLIVRLLAVGTQRD